MDKQTKRKIFIVIAIVLSVLGVLCAIFYPENKEVSNTIGTYQNIVIEEIRELENEIEIEDITENEEMSSTENTIEEASIEEEKELESEEVNIEIEGFELQNEEDISYDGDTAKTWDIELGEYQGLTYYSQIDTRWKNILYTSIGKQSQTIGSSGCRTNLC